jgi:hypothetical protein
MVTVRVRTRVRRGMARQPTTIMQDRVQEYHPSPDSSPVYMPLAFGYLDGNRFLGEEMLDRLVFVYKRATAKEWTITRHGLLT